MQQQFDDIEMRLWEYLDGNCTSAEKARIAQLIETDAIWKQKHLELTAFQQELSTLESHQPSMRFTANVMDGIADVKIAPSLTTGISNWIVKGIAAFFILTMVGIVVYSFATANWAADGSSFLPSFAVSSSLVIFINVVLGLILADKLANRKKQQTQSL